MLLLNEAMDWLDFKVVFSSQSKTMKLEFPRQYEVIYLS